MLPTGPDHVLRVEVPVPLVVVLGALRSSLNLTMSWVGLMTVALSSLVTIGVVLGADQNWGYMSEAGPLRSSENDTTVDKTPHIVDSPCQYHQQETKVFQERVPTGTLTMGSSPWRCPQLLGLLRFLILLHR